MTYRLIQGDNRHVLKQFPDDHFDSIVTDPPYGIDFLGKAWDANTGALETYQECLRVLKPGGHILAFSAARTYHHLAITLEQAGFEIRDQIMWIYSSGFPKSQDVGKSIERSEKKRANAKSGDKWENADGGTGVNTTTCRTCNKNNVMIGAFFKCDKEICDMRERLKPADNEWAGWGTALKPAHEPIALARKPIKTSIAKNVERYGVGALNIDATRVPFDASDGDPHTAIFAGKGTNWHQAITQESTPRGTLADRSAFSNPDLGRFPSNVIGEIEEPYQKYFYCPKVSRQERHCGFEDPGPQTARERDADGRVLNRPAKKAGASATVLVEQFQLDSKGNNHPTVKPVALMEYLIKLITPPNGLVLDPFNGSGSTGMAAVGLGFDYIGIDLDPNYIEISKKRIEAWHALQNPNLFKELFEDAIE